MVAESAGYIDSSADPLQLRIRLYETLASPLAEGLLLSDWLHELDQKLSLGQIISDADDRSDDAETLEELTNAARKRGLLQTQRCQTLRLMAEFGERLC